MQQTSNYQEQNAQPGSRRVKRRRRSLRSRIKRIRLWIARHPLEAFLGVLLLVAVTLFLNPFPAFEGILGRLPFGIGNSLIGYGEWLAYEGGAQYSAIAFVVAAAGVVLVRIRSRLFQNRRWWSLHCPQCHQAGLKRIHRNRRDRLLGIMGIPVRRYRCAGCQWHGRRIDETRV